MSGQCRFRRDGACFAVADFSDENDIRILAENGTQRTCKIEVFFRIHLYLVHRIDQILDRIFNGDYISFDRFYLVECCIKRCALAAAGRTRHQHQSIRLFEQVHQYGKIVR